MMSYLTLAGGDAGLFTCLFVCLFVGAYMMSYLTSASRWELQFVRVFFVC